MNVAPYVFKSKAMRALKGNWQTALLVSFMADLPMVVSQLMQNTGLRDISLFSTREAILEAVLAVPSQTWFWMGMVSGLALVVTPVLAVGSNYYFICRLRKQELGFSGVFSRMKVFLKAFFLYLLIVVKVFLWSLLLVVPGIVAMLNYSMAPYYLAEHPESSVWEALNFSKQAMKNQKMNYLLLYLSFIGWLLMAMISEMLLGGISVILALVVSQFIQLYMTTYLNAATASFYLAVSSPDGMAKTQAEAAAWLRSIGWPGRRPFGGDSGPDDSSGAGGDTQNPDGGDERPGEDDNSGEPPDDLQ
ncbi:MAG: DUF975 family protein [Eubacteriales bacterium]|nr:DUF975 family protein [Eubacteriales bacterium]